MKVFLVLSAIMISLVSTAVAGPVIESNVDLWQGASVTGASPILYHGSNYYSDARNMFGGNYGTLGNGTYFEDSAYYTGPQWITWKTAAPVTIGSFNLFTPDYNVPRSYSWFKLYAEGITSPIYTFTPTATFGGIVSATIAPVTADDFRAEFGWSSVGGIWNSSALVSELDGFAPAAVPEPATMSLLGLGLAGLLRFRRKKV
jgi:PEP-CTERM putative exosortase interaction domain